MNKLINFLKRLFPFLFKQVSTKPVEAPTIVSPDPVATTLPTPVPQPTVTIPTAPTPLPPPSFGPLAPSEAPEVIWPRNGDVLAPGTSHGFRQGTDHFIVDVTAGKPIQLATSDGYGSGYVKLYDSAGNLVQTSTIGGGYSSLYFIPSRDDNMTVQIVCSQGGKIDQQLGQQ